MDSNGFLCAGDVVGSIYQSLVCRLSKVDKLGFSTPVLSDQLTYATSQIPDKPGTMAYQTCLVAGGDQGPFMGIALGTPAPPMPHLCPYSHALVIATIEGTYDDALSRSMEIALTENPPTRILQRLVAWRNGRIEFRSAEQDGTLTWVNIDGIIQHHLAQREPLVGAKIMSSDGSRMSIIIEIPYYCHELIEALANLIITTPAAIGNLAPAQTKEPAPAT